MGLNSYSQSFNVGNFGLKHISPNPNDLDPSLITALYLVLIDSDLFESVDTHEFERSCPSLDTRTHVVA